LIASKSGRAGGPAARMNGCIVSTVEVTLLLLDVLFDGPQPAEGRI
jgi:hypothetical protein